MKISVTAECIELGTPRLTFKCPVAIALEKAGLRDAAVSSYDLYWQSADGLFHRRLMPENVRRAVRLYDASNGVMEPFEFELEDA